jgi:ATP-dependent protease HslVU (ClpYQ) peptidase subunit
VTTLVYRAGVLAADSRTTTGDVIEPGAWPKIGRLKDGRAWGYCGCTTSAMTFVRVLDAGGDEKCGEATVVVIGDTIEVFDDGGSYLVPPAAPFMAWGSGRAAALGALYVGASAHDAVVAACQVDTGSGGPVQSLECGRAENADASRQDNDSLRRDRSRRKTNSTGRTSRLAEATR